MVKHFDDERWPLAGLPANAAVVGETRAREWQHGGVCAVAVTRPVACPAPHATDSYLVDPASNICLFQRLSHACLRISELIQ